MIRLKFEEYEVELENDRAFTIGSNDNNFKYDFVYHDKDAMFYLPSCHTIKVFKAEQIYRTAVVCAVAGATGIHENSAVIVDRDILICCADTVFSLALPDLKLNWLTQIDEACCFQIFKNNVGVFVHGELAVSRIDQSGNIIWSEGFADITVTPDGRESFIMHEDFIEIEDWQHNKYKLSFDGKFI